MKITNEQKERVLSEFDFVIKKMTEESDPLKKLYFFSATFGAVERVMRYCPSEDLLIAHAVLTLCYSTLNERVSHIRVGDVVVPLSQDWSEKLVHYVGELRKSIEENSSVYPALEGIIHLAYSASGPGFYTTEYNEYFQTRAHKQEG
jgi:hypothetical protein